MQPGRRGGHGAPSPLLPHHQHPLLRVLIAMVVIAAVAALVAYLVVRITNRRAARRGPDALAGSSVADPALEQLRLRYARGEVSRTDYLQALADLGARPPEPSPA